MSYFGSSHGASGGRDRGQREFVTRKNEAESMNNADGGADDEAEEGEEEEEEEDSFGCDAADRIKRSYHLPAASQVSSAGLHQQQQAIRPETIQVTLNESYFANERRLFVNSLANVRQKLHSLQLFNPAKNESMKQQAEEAWNEKEKYTLDSLNELKGQLDERFQWNKPEDGREVWPSKLQYFLAITSYSIGLGNVIRFPILVQKNGGLAFIIPFVIMLLLEGIPLFYLELAIGQRMRKAAISCWNLVSPFAAGIGLASAAVSFLIGLYYNTMVAWTLIYTWAATTNRLPPGDCPSSSGLQDDNIVASQAQRHEQQSDSNVSVASLDECQLGGPFEYYWYRQTLDVTGDVDDWSNFNWPIAFCLLLAWLISYICLVKGLSSSKRLVYIISIFPYVILVIFFFRAINLRGMNHGLRYLFEPDWSKLFDPFVWLQAAAQVFFSLGLGFGGLIALSSYNSINNNCYKDAIKVSLINFFTSMLAGVVIFSILGFKATINYDKCQLEREQQIDFYLADYNLKVLDYGAVFKQVPMPAPKSRGGKLRARRSTGASTATTSDTGVRLAPEVGQLESAANNEGSKKRKKKRMKAKRKKKTTKTDVSKVENNLSGVARATVARDNTRKSPVAEFIADRNDTRTQTAEEESFQTENNTSSSLSGSSSSVSTVVPTSVALANRTASGNSINATSEGSYKVDEDDDQDEEGEFSADDAIASINNLDRQLDMGSPSGTFDYGDSDTEFILNASHLIDRRELEQIIDNINNLQVCSIEQELDASTQGTALVFVAIAEAISQFDWADRNATAPIARSFFHLSSSTWAILFFLMILALGLDSQFGNLEGLLSSLTDLNFFNLNSNNRNSHSDHNGHQQQQAPSTAAAGLAGMERSAGSQAAAPAPPTIITVRKYATGVICCLSLALSVVLFAHGAGSYMFAIFDEYAANFSLILIALFELLTISYIYGLKRFCDDCELMTGKRPPFIVLLSWRYISPILLLIIVFTTIKQFTVELNYDVWSAAAAVASGETGQSGSAAAAGAAAEAPAHLLSKTWPNWCILFGALLIISCVIWIPLIAVLRIMRITVIPEEKRRCWFPVEELKEFHQLQDQEHQVTRLERILFGFNQDDD